MAPSTKLWLLAVDDYESGGGSGREHPLKGARLIDPATMREVGASGCGAWNGYAAAVLAAYQDAVSKGHA